jgi:hypothetical protein
MHCHAVRPVRPPPQPAVSEEIAGNHADRSLSRVNGHELITVEKPDPAAHLRRCRDGYSQTYPQVLWTSGLAVTFF